jgi:BirA family biotin operon repressor/biotin-[acetyl-CoA-carboxylase] ligase
MVADGMMSERLDKTGIDAGLTDRARMLITDIEIHQTLDSTNSYLLERARSHSPSGLVCLAEQQTAGRGRRGRCWISPYAANLYLSILWRFQLPVKRMTTLSLATGLALIHALQELGVGETGVKWPNDILWRQRKLAGILVELEKTSDAGCSAVIGIGINVDMPADVVIDQPWIDIAGIPGVNEAINRNQLAAAVLNHLSPLLADFTVLDSAEIIDQWCRFDVFRNHPVVVKLADKNIRGTARGVAADGALLLETQAGLSRYTVGEISFRPQYSDTTPD